MLDTPCSEVVWRVPATHSIRQFPLHLPSLRHRLASHFNWSRPLINRNTNKSPMKGPFSMQCICWYNMYSSIKKKRQHCMISLQPDSVFHNPQKFHFFCEQSKLADAIRLLTCIRQLHGSNLGLQTTVRIFSQSFKAKSGNDSKPLPSPTLPQHSTIIQPCDARHFFFLR